jgi:hypothetical protein
MRRQFTFDVLVGVTVDGVWSLRKAKVRASDEERAGIAATDALFRKLYNGNNSVSFSGFVPTYA